MKIQQRNAGKYTWITNWNQQSSLNVYNFIRVKNRCLNEGIHRKLFTNVQERVLILFLSSFFLLGAIKNSDILPRRTRIKDKKTRSFVSQRCRTMYYMYRLRIDPWTMMQWIWNLSNTTIQSYKYASYDIRLLCTIHQKLHYSKGNNNDLVRHQSSIFVMKALFDNRKCLQCIQSTF